MRIEELKVLSYELVAEHDELPGPHVRQVMLDRVKQSDGSDKWAIRMGGTVLNKSGRWEYEPMPSSRTDAFIRRARFNSEHEALQVWQRRKEPLVG